MVTRLQPNPDYPAASLVSKVASAWLDVTLAVQRDIAVTYGRWLEEAGVAVAGGTQPPRPDLLGLRLTDFVRATWFLWAEAGLRVQERLSRLGQAALEDLLPAQAVGLTGGVRGLALGIVAADMYVGYLTLRNRARCWPGLVQLADWEIQHQRGATRVLDTTTALGGVLIKACQFVASRPDLVPRAYAERLAVCQDRVPPHAWPMIEPAIVEALGGRPLASVFDAVESEPMAAASLAQVHRARLPDGRRVALKVRYPEIPALVAADLAALDRLVQVLTAVEPTIRLEPVLAYLRSTLPLELDFRREARAIAALRAALAHRTDVVIPAVVEELSGEALLVTELVEGIKITDAAGLAVAGIDTSAVARLLNDVYAEQILRVGMLHADPHPGNLLVQPGPRLVLLDHGLTVELPPGLVDALRRMVRALTQLDFEALGVALADAGLPGGAGGEVLGLLDLAGALGGTEQPERAPDWQQVGRGLGNLPVDLVLVGRALALLDGITRVLDPDLNALEIVARYA